MPQGEIHRTEHIGWPRAAVLGANDGLISTSSLVVGVAAAAPAPGGARVTLWGALAMRDRAANRKETT